MTATALVALSVTAGSMGTASGAESDGLMPLGVYNSGEGSGAAEIAAYDAASQRLFITNGAGEPTVDIVDVSNPSAPALVTSVNLAAYGDGIQSVAVGNGQVAAALDNADPTADGTVVLMSTDGAIDATFTVGVLPDMVTFTPDGTKIVVANEGEPVCGGEGGEELVADPEGSISIIDIAGNSVSEATFGSFTKEALLAEGVRIFFPGSTAAQDLEPEYVAVSDDGATAFVTLQENNAVAVVDIATATVTDIVPLGYKDHSIEGNSIDPSNEDDPEAPGESGVPNLGLWPLLGMYMPDAIAAHDIGGETYLFTANEGDARDYDCYSEEIRVRDLVDDAVVEGVTAPGLADPPYAADTTDDENLGRLKTTTAFPTTLDDADEVPQIYSYGARSFTIWNTAGEVVFDSGDDFATELLETDFFNLDDFDIDGRSDDKGAEPEAIAVGEHDGRVFAFIGLERSGGIMMYDVTDPANSSFITYVNTAETDSGVLVEDVTGAGDISPESIDFIPAADSPTGTPLIAVAFEVSGTTRLFEVLVESVPETTTTTTTTVAPATTTTAVVPTTVPTTDSPTTTVSGILPETGSASTGALLATLLVLAGVGALWWSRRVA